MVEKNSQTCKKLKKNLGSMKSSFVQLIPRAINYSQPFGQNCFGESDGNNVEVAVGVNKIPGKRCPIFCCRINPSRHSLRPEYCKLNKPTEAG